LLGAVVYAPIVVGVGYAVGLGLGHRIEEVRRAAGDAEKFLWIGLIVAAIGAWIVLARRARRHRSA
jgi:hypothetical protein